MKERDIVWWLVWIAGLSPIWGAFVWHTYEFHIRPHRIPRTEIDRLVDEIATRNPEDPDYSAFLEEQAAWYRSDTFEQGKWRRLRRALWRNEIK